MKTSLARLLGVVGLGVWLGAVGLRAEGSPLGRAVAAAAEHLPAGGFVFAEVEGRAISFGSYGSVGVSGGVSSDRVIFEIGAITKLFVGLVLA